MKIVSHLAKSSTLKKTYSPRSMRPRPSAANRISRTFVGDAQRITTENEKKYDPPNRDHDILLLGNVIVSKTEGSIFLVPLSRCPLVK